MRVKKLENSGPKLMQGNEACAAGALAADCRFMAGYPITPATEIPEYLSSKMFEAGGVFMQMEDELASINAVIGASWGGVRAMTATSGPGYSLMIEGIGYAAETETPLVVVNVMRGGPATGQPTCTSQDAIMQTRYGGHGDYEIIALTPSSVQEAFDFTVRAFNLAEKYRVPVLILADGIMAQMMEPVEMPEMRDFKVDPEKKPWACTGWKPGDDPAKRGIINSIYIDTESLAIHNDELQAMYKEVVANEQMWESYNCENADYIITAFGTVARIAKSAIAELKEKGINVGLVRPITVWPFPYDAVHEACCQPSVKAVLDVELNEGQMLEDVKLALNGAKSVDFFGHCGSQMPSTTEIVEKILSMKEGK